MRTTDLNQPLTAKALNESLFKQYNVKINFDKYTREQLEDARNKYRSNVFQTEAGANFNELLSNESYQKDKFILSVLNTKIKEMLGESIALAERAVSKAQQQAAGIALAAKKSGKKPAGKGASAEMSKMSAKELEKFAGTKHKGLPKHKKTDEAIRVKNVKGSGYGEIPAKGERGQDERDQAASAVKHARKPGGNSFDYKMKQAGLEVAEGSKPDFLDMDKDGNKKETMKKAVADKKKNPFAKVKEATKPLKGGQKKLDTDKDGDIDATDMKNLRAKKKAVKESKSELLHKAYQSFIAEGIATYIAEDEEGKAKSITAAADMVNDFTSWMQRVGNYQTKSMIELADNIRANFGMQEAETFKQTVGSALEGALQSLTQAREEINNAVAVLAGEAPAEEPMGQEPGMEAPEAMPDEMNMPADEFAASDAAAGGPEEMGRMKRESIERGNRLMKILGS